MTEPGVYLADSSGLIELDRLRVRLNALARLVADGRLKWPSRVAAEIRRGDGRLVVWINTFAQGRIPETSANMAELARISQRYGSILSTAQGAADPIVVAMASHFEGVRTVITNDIGVQAVCALERLPYVTAQVFRRLENL